MENSPNSGSSNSDDFQPPTVNPQQAPGNIFPRQDAVQDGGQNQLLENSNSRIIVPVNPAQAPLTVTEAKSDAGAFVMLAIVIALVLLGLHAWRRKIFSLIQPKTSSEPIANSEPPAPIVASAPPAKPTNPAKKAARKAAKKRKRSRK